jgi:hypothetical protein
MIMVLGHIRDMFVAHADEILHVFQERWKLLLLDQLDTNDRAVGPLGLRRQNDFAIADGRGDAHGSKMAQKECEVESRPGGIPRGCE